MTSKDIWTFVRSGGLAMNDGYDPHYPPHEYPLIIRGFLDHDDDQKIYLPIAVPENEQIARQLIDLGGKWVALRAAEDAESEDRPNNVVHMRSASLDNGELA